MEQALEYLNQLPSVLIYGVLGLGAALENLIPLLPADTFIVAGGFAAGLGRINPLGIFAVTWGLNVAGAMAVYGAGYRYGLTFFSEGKGRRLLSVRQLEKLESFYTRWGILAIFFARFLPGLRALVPVFAGVTKQRLWAVLPPVTIASAMWYGALVRLGFLTGENLEGVLATLGTVNRAFLLVSLVVFTVLGACWRRSRNSPLPRDGVEE